MAYKRSEQGDISFGFLSLQKTLYFSLMAMFASLVLFSLFFQCFSLTTNQVEQYFGLFFSEANGANESVENEREFKQVPAIKPNS